MIILLAVVGLGIYLALAYGNLWPPFRIKNWNIDPEDVPPDPPKDPPKIPLSDWLSPEQELDYRMWCMRQMAARRFLPQSWREETREYFEKMPFGEDMRVFIRQLVAEENLRSPGDDIPLTTPGAKTTQNTSDLTPTTPLTSLNGKGLPVKGMPLEDLPRITLMRNSEIEKLAQKEPKQSQPQKPQPESKERPGLIISFGPGERMRMSSNDPTLLQESLEKEWAEDIKKYGQPGHA
jgi:hypothetical protein